MFWVYVIINNKDKIYIGQTSNLENRLNRHNGFLSNKKTSYTHINKGLWEVVYQEEYTSRKEAVMREKYLKSHIGRDWLRKKWLCSLRVDQASPDF